MVKYFLLFAIDLGRESRDPSAPFRGKKGDLQ